MERQYTSSAYVIDFQSKKILLMYNKKLDKWLQPGGHIEANEMPTEAAVREVKEETGIDIDIISKNFFGDIIPIYIERYINKVGDMIDLQYLAVPLTINSTNSENNRMGWFNETELSNINVASDVKIKMKQLLNVKSIQ